MRWGVPHLRAPRYRAPVDGWVGVLVTGAAVVAWALYLDIHHESDARLAAWWLARARRVEARSIGPDPGPDAFLVSTGFLVCFSALAWAADRTADALGEPLWALAVTVPAMLAYAPFVLATMPTQGGAYWSWRQELEAVGADTNEQRAIAWWAGPPSLAGMMAMLVSLVTTFVP